MNKLLIAAMAIASLSSVEYGPIPAVHYQVIDGRIHLIGTFQQLAGIEVVSAGKHLTLDTLRIPDTDEDIPLKLPFSLEDGSIVRNTPTAVVLGVLGAGKRIDIEGNTPTSILYAGDNAQAKLDLAIRVGLGDDAPVELQWKRQKLTLEQLGIFVVFRP